MKDEEMEGKETEKAARGGTGWGTVHFLKHWDAEPVEKHG